MRELAAYSPTRSHRAITIDVEDGSSEPGILELLTAIETCLTANEIPSVTVKLNRKTYLLAPSG